MIRLKPAVFFSNTPDLRNVRTLGNPGAFVFGAGTHRLFLFFLCACREALDLTLSMTSKPREAQLSFRPMAP